MTSALAGAVQSAVGQHPFVVALGGGADSATLLHAAVADRTKASVRAVFVLHRLPSSELLMRSAEKIATHLGVELLVIDGPVEDGPDLEARARDVRYEAIEAILDEGELVLTAHTADDQAETVLMRLMRGSGASGISGIPSARGPWRRPFLPFRREELRTEAVRLGLPFVDDPANEDDRLLRSRIRHRLLPEIEDGYAPGFSRNLVRAASLAQLDDEQLTSLSDQIPVTVVAGNVALPAAPILTATPPVASRAVRSALRRCGDPYPGSMGDVAAVMEVASGGATAVISGNIHVRYEPPMIVFQAGGQQVCDTQRNIGGVASFRWNGHSYLVRNRPRPTPFRTAGRFSVVSAPSQSAALGIRGPRHGDRLDIGVGATPVTELLRDHGIASIHRSLWPLVTIDGKIAAVHGVRSATWASPRDEDEVIIIEQEVHS